MRRKRKMNVVSVWIIVIFTVIAVTLVSLFMLVYSSILRSEVQDTLREQVEVLRDNADTQVIDIIENQLARRIAVKDVHTGYINAMANGHIPSVAEIRALSAYFAEVKATLSYCQRLELYFPSTQIVVGSQGIQYLSDRKYSVNNSSVDYLINLYPSDDTWIKRAVVETGNEENHITFLRLYPGVFPAGQEPMLAVSIEEYNFLSLLRSSMRTLSADDFMMLVDYSGMVWCAEADENAEKEGRSLLAGTQLPSGELSTDSIMLSNGQRGMVAEASSLSGGWYYALLQPASARTNGYGSLVGVWALLCVAMLLIGLFLVLQVMTKHYSRPMQRLVNSLDADRPADANERALDSPSEHFLQIESALSDMNKLKQEREHFMTHNQPLLRQSWLNCFIQGEAFYSIPHPQLGIEFPYPNFQVVIASCEPSAEEIDCLRSAMHGKQYVMEQFESREKETVLLFNHPYEEGVLPDLLMKAAEGLEEMQSELVLGVGILSENDELVPASFRCARRSFAYRYFDKNQRVCVFDPKARYAEPENALSEIINQLTELTSLIQRESQEKVEQAIDTIVTQLKETTPYMNTMRSIMLITAMRLAKMVYDMKGAPEEVYGDNLLNAYYHIGGISEFSQRLKHDCELLRRYLSKESSPANRSVVQYAIHHIQNAVPAELSIHSIAEAIGISTGHLSRMFHQETGRKLVDYLQEVRMEHAARLIAEGELSNEEICDRIGYSRPQYFASKFKEHYGLTINEYRRKLQHGQEHESEN